MDLPYAREVLSATAAGLGVGMSLIVAIGAQNLFLLRHGIRRDRPVLVAAVCALSDAILIALGVSGVGLLVAAVPWLIVAVRWAGAAFLVGYGALAARRAWRGTDAGLRADADGPPTRTRVGATLATALALTWLNPHVYLDTVFLLGTVAAGYGPDRWWFAAGAAAASILWFFGLAFGGRLLSGLLASPRSWRILDAVIAVVMVAIGVSLVVLP